MILPGAARSRPGRTRAPLALALLASVGCGRVALPPDASAHGFLTDALLIESAWAGAALGLVAMVWLAVAVGGLLRRAPPGAPADTRTSRGAVVVLALGAFLVVDGHLFLGDRRVQAVLRAARADRGTPAVRIEVNAQRWAFLFRHPGRDGVFNTPDDIVTTNSLRLPAGRPVEFQLAASDVVHGLRIPALRIQTDAIPGRITKLWALPDREGTWPFQCSQHCGTAHYRMRGELEVIAPERYDAWVEEASARAVLREDPDDPRRHWGWEWRP